MAKEEIVEALKNITNPEGMRAFLKGLDKEGIEELGELVRRADEETEKRWNDAYSEMMKYDR